MRWQASSSPADPRGASGKESTCQCMIQEMRVLSLGWKDPLEQEMAPHFSSLAWKIVWAEDSGRLQSMGFQTVGHV